MADGDEIVEEEQEQVVVTALPDTETVVVTQVEKPLAPPKYEVRPRLGDKFQAQNVRDIIMTTMEEQLIGRSYRVDLAPRWAKMIANGVRARVQGLDMKRYKILVQSTIMEMKGAGVKCAQRCIWDPETDHYADNLYRNDTIYCHTVVYGVYMY